MFPRTENDAAFGRQIWDVYAAYRPCRTIERRFSNRLPSDDA
jgi:hypothetical protein